MREGGREGSRGPVWNRGTCVPFHYLTTKQVLGLHGSILEINVFFVSFSVFGDKMGREGK